MVYKLTDISHLEKMSEIKEKTPVIPEVKLFEGQAETSSLDNTILSLCSKLRGEGFGKYADGLEDPPQMACRPPEAVQIYFLATRELGLKPLNLSAQICQAPRGHARRPLGVRAGARARAVVPTLQCRDRRPRLRETGALARRRCAP